MHYMSELAVILMSEIIPANRLAHELSLKERWTREKGITEEGWELAGFQDEQSENGLPETSQCALFICCQVTCPQHFE